MTSHTGRLYALSLALVVFFLTWTVIAARPWVTAQADPRLSALAVREQHLRKQSLVVRRLVQQRWAVYRVRLHDRQKQIAARQKQIIAAHQAQLAATAAATVPSAPSAAAGPSVRVVSLPPITVTRTS
jgi:hypothetical protein